MEEEEFERTPRGKLREHTPRSDRRWQSPFPKYDPNMSQDIETKSKRIVKLITKTLGAATTSLELTRLNLEEGLETDEHTHFDKAEAHAKKLVRDLEAAASHAQTLLVQIRYSKTKSVSCDMCSNDAILIHEKSGAVFCSSECYKLMK